MTNNYSNRLSSSMLGSTMRVSVIAIGWLFLSLAINATIMAQDNHDANSTLFDDMDSAQTYEFSSIPPLNEPPKVTRKIPSTLKPIVSGDSVKASRSVSVSQLLKSNDLQPIPATAKTVSHESETDGAESKRQILQPVYHEPNSSVAKTNTIGARESDVKTENFYQLQNLTWQTLEQRLVDTWHNRLKAVTSEDGRYSRVMIPTRNDTSYLPMLIDRSKNVLTYEGPDHQNDVWKRIVRGIDGSGNASKVVHLIDMEKAQSQTIQKAAFIMGFQEEQQPDNTVRRRVDLPQDINRNGQRPIVLTQGPDQDTGVKGPVKIEVVPDMGIIILTGEAADVAKVQKMINDIIAKSDESQPEIESILLKNQQSNTVAEQIQTLYDDRFADRKGTASITPLAQPNSLIVIGQPEAVRVIKEIVEIIDVETTGDVAPEFRTYKLKHMSAVDAKNRIDEYFGQSTQSARTETQPPALPVVTIADYRSNTLIVKATASLLDQVTLLLNDIDVDTSGSTNVVKVIPLKNALASDMATVLQDAINGQLVNAGRGINPGSNQQGQNLNQNRSQDAAGSSLRSAMLELMTDGPNGELIKGGIMFDVRVTADANSNSIVVTGPEASMGLIEELVKRLDRIPDAETQIKVFPIINGDAESILGTLQALFTGSAQGGQQLANQQGGNLSTLPLQTASASDGGSLINLRFGFDERTNTIIVSGPASDLIVVDDLIYRLDESNPDGRQTKVYRLSNLSAEDMAAAINNWLDDREAFNDEDPTLVNEITRVRRLVSVTPVSVGNSLIVSAVPEYYAEIARIIHELDRKPTMVKVKVMLAEIDLTSLEEFGVDIGFQDSLLFDRGTAMDPPINFLFNQAGIGNDNVARGSLLGQALSNLGTGRTNSDLGYGGLVLSAGNDSISVLVRALMNKGSFRVLAKPHMMTLENLQGRIQVGAQVPRITSSQPTAIGGVQNSFEDVDVGIILEVTPRVSPDGTIVMFVSATRSRLGDESSGIAVATSSTGEIIRSPEIISTVAQTTIQARSGQTVVISGLVQEDKVHTKRGVPILSDLPVIGPLFMFERDLAVRKELLIIMTPYIVDSDEDIAMQNQDEMDRIHWCLSDVAEVYGNTQYDGSPIRSASPDIYYPDLDPTGLEPQQEMLPQQGDFYQQEPATGQNVLPPRQNQSAPLQSESPPPQPGFEY